RRPRMGSKREGGRPPHVPSPPRTSGFLEISDRSDEGLGRILGETARSCKAVRRGWSRSSAGGQPTAGNQGIADRLEDGAVPARTGVLVPFGDTEFLHAEVIECVGEVEKIQPLAVGDLADDAAEPLGFVLAVGPGEQEQRQGYSDPLRLGGPSGIDVL